MQSGNRSREGGNMSNEPQRMKIDDFLDKHCSETCDKAGLTDCAVDFESCAKSRQLKIILEGMSGT